MIFSNIVASLENFPKARYTSTSGATNPAVGWSILAINKEFGNTIKGFGVSSNQMYVPPGRYLVEVANGPGRTNVYFMTLYNVGSASLEQLSPDGGTTNYEAYFAQRSDSGDGISRDQGLTFLNIEIDTPQIYELRLYTQTTGTWTSTGQTQYYNGYGGPYFIDWIRLGDYEDYS